MARPRGNNITMAVCLREDPKFFDYICEKAKRYDGSVAAYIIRIIKERETADCKKATRLRRKLA